MKAGLFSVLVLVWTWAAYAETPATSPAQAAQAIQEILGDKPFQTHRELKRWQRRDSLAVPPKDRSTWPGFGADSAQDERRFDLDFQLPAGFIKTLALLLEVALWTAVLIALLGLGWQLYRYYQRRRGQANPLFPPGVSPQYHRSLANLALPVSDTLNQQAWSLWEAGDAAAALSLLYRSALGVMQQRDALPIPDSATENECLRLVQRQQPAPTGTYFAALTRAWQQTAYAHQPPAHAEARQLCDAWPQHFARQTKTP